MSASLESRHREAGQVLRAGVDHGRADAGEEIPLAARAGIVELPRFFAERYAPPRNFDAQLSATLSSLNPAVFWPAPLPHTSHEYRRNMNVLIHSLGQPAGTKWRCYAATLFIHTGV